MSFSFQQYGTFAGPGSSVSFRENDEFSFDSGESFNLTDVSMCLVNTTTDYAYMHLNGTSTASVTLERSTGPISLFNVQSNVSVFSGEVYSNAGGHRLSSKKNFDIPHPNKSGWRLRHTCLEGPENAVYYRGRLSDSNFIELPEYWKNFVSLESISVSLTQIGSNQNLIIEEITTDFKVIIRSDANTRIDCYYIIYGNRIDGENLIVEYEGNNPGDYPGNNNEYSVVGWNYDVRVPSK